MSTLFSVTAIFKALKTHVVHPTTGICQQCQWDRHNTNSNIGDIAGALHAWQ
jgi:hypothetical protein